MATLFLVCILNVSFLYLENLIWQQHFFQRRNNWLGIYWFLNFLSLKTPWFDVVEDAFKLTSFVFLAAPEHFKTTQKKTKKKGSKKNTKIQKKKKKKLLIIWEKSKLETKKERLVELLLNQRKKGSLFWPIKKEKTWDNS
jgi:hypothetical protein